ncbi:ATP-binding cassette domain-containing protein [Endozoicomonadaceae bacterium StTr2]
MIKERWPVLSFENLGVVASNDPEKRILDDFSLVLKSGEVHALIGDSGSGKSVAALCALRLLPEGLKIKAGKIFVNHPGEGKVNLFDLPENKLSAIRGKRVAMIFQDAHLALNPVQTIGRQIAEALQLHAGKKKSECRESVLELLQEVGLPQPEQRIDWYPHQLSSGQLQKAQIAMALACESEVLIADEPASSMDTINRQKVLKLIRQLARYRQLAVLLITRDMGVVRQTADRVTVVQQGKVIEQMLCETFFRYAQHEHSQQLISRASNPTEEQQWLEEITSDDAAIAPLLKVSELDVNFPLRRRLFQWRREYAKAVRNTSFNIHRGESLALIGESGCGKSTIGRAILKLEKIDHGEIYLDGKRIDNLSRRKMRPLRAKIQMIFQTSGAAMNPRMTVGDIIAEGMISLGTERSAQKRLERIEYLLGRAGLDPECRHYYPHELSEGERQRVAIIRALAVEPELMICDEPTRALDTHARTQILELLTELQQSKSTSYLFITHDLAAIPQLAHRVAVVKNGHIIEQGPAQTVLQHPQQGYTRRLLAAVPRADVPADVIHTSRYGF